MFRIPTAVYNYPCTDEKLFSIRAIADYLNVRFYAMKMLIRFAYVPGLVRVARRGNDIWAMSVADADAIILARSATPEYNLRRISERFVAAHGYHLPPTFPDASISEDIESLLGPFQTTPFLLVKRGEATMLSWCDALSKERERCRMSQPMFMHRRNLERWAADRIAECEAHTEETHTIPFEEDDE